MSDYKKKCGHRGVNGMAEGFCEFVRAMCDEENCAYSKDEPDIVPEDCCQCCGKLLKGGETVFCGLCDREIILIAERNENKTLRAELEKLKTPDKCAGCGEELTVNPYCDECMTDMAITTLQDEIKELHDENDALTARITGAEKEAADYRQFWKNAIDEVQKHGNEIASLKAELKIMEMDRTMQAAAAEEMEKELSQAGDAIWNAITLLATRGTDGGIVYHTQLEVVTKAVEFLTEVMTSE